MKSALVVLTVFASLAAQAVPGWSTLTCSSKAGAKQKLSLYVSRYNDYGTENPSIKVTLDGKQYVAETPDIEKQYGVTIHDAALGDIVVTADNDSEDKAKTKVGLALLSVPGTVHAFDSNGKPLKFVPSQDTDECNDGNGHAVFKGHLRGFMYQGEQSITLPTDNLDCKIAYSTGSAC